MKSAVITGPTGSIGTALIEHLISNGIEVLAIVRPDSKRTDNIPTHPLVTKLKLNLNELDKVPNYLDGKNYDVFYHLGWDGTFGNSRNKASIIFCDTADEQ